MSLPPSRMPTNSFCSLSCSCKVQRRTRFAGSCPRACCKSLVTYWSRRKYSIECHTTGWLCPTKLPETVIPALGEVVSSVSAADCGVVHVPLVCWKYRRDASKSQRRNRRLVAGRVISRWSRCDLASPKVVVLLLIQSTQQSEFFCPSLSVHVWMAPLKAPFCCSRSSSGRPTVRQSASNHGVFCKVVTTRSSTTPAIAQRTRKLWTFLQPLIMASSTNAVINDNDASVCNHNALIKIVSYNMHGFNQGYAAIDLLISSENPDIFFCQEHWLTPANLQKFDDHFPDFFPIGCSAMSDRVQSGMLIGRPFGGVMILVNERLRNLTKTICCEERFVIIKIADYLCVNIYLPCIGTINRLSICEAVLYDVWSWLERYPNCPLYQHRLYYAPISIGRGIMKWGSVSVIHPSVRLSVCRVPSPNSRTERSRKPKIGRMEAHHAGNQWTYLEVKRSPWSPKGLEVTRPINAAIDNAWYGNRRVFPWCKGESVIK